MILPASVFPALTLTARGALVLTWVAGPTRVAGVTRRASTGGSMQSCGADGVDAAALNPACVDARSGVALLVDAAVIVNHALGPGFHCGQRFRVKRAGLG